MAKKKDEKKKMLAFRVQPELHRLLRMRAGSDVKTIEAVAVEALERHLMHRLPPHRGRAAPAEACAMTSGHKVLDTV